MKIPELIALLLIGGLGTALADHVWFDKYQLETCEMTYQPAATNDASNREKMLKSPIRQKIRVVYTFSPREYNHGFKGENVVGITIFFGDQMLKVPKDLFEEYPRLNIRNCMGVSSTGSSYWLEFRVNSDGKIEKGVPAMLQLYVTDKRQAIIALCDGEQRAIPRFSRFFPVESTKAEQDGAGQPATRPESESEGGDKPQPEAEGRSR